MKTLKEFFLRNHKRLIIISSAALIIYSLINIYFIVEVNVISNDECLWVPEKINEDSTAIFFDLVKVDGVTWKAGIRDGDQLLSINDTPLPTIGTATQVLNQLKEGDYAKYLVKSNGRIFETNVYVKKLFSFPLFAQSLLGFFFILIGTVVILANPNGTIQKLFYSISVVTVPAASLSILQSANAVVELPLGMVLVLIIMYFWSVSTCYLPFLTLYFFWVFPRRFKFIEKKWLIYLLFIIPGILSIITFILLLFIFYYNLFHQSMAVPIAIALQIITSICNIVAYISLIINYRRLSREEKKPIFVILAAYTLSMAAAIYTGLVAPAITDTVFNSPEFYAPIILVVFFPLAFAYSIFRYQLMDVSVVVKNTIFYGAATLSIAAVYFLVIYVIGQGLSQFITTSAEYQVIITGVIFISFALLFQSSKDKFQNFLTAKFYPEQFTFQNILIKFSREVSSMVGLDNILDFMRDTFVNALHIKRFGILILDKKNNEFYLVRSLGISGFSLEANDKFHEFIHKKSDLLKNIAIEREEFNEAFPLQYQKLVDEEIYTIIPMIIKSQVIGLLLFGLKHSGAKFAGKDIELLNAAGNQSAIAIENARLYESEAEKIKIEQDLNLARKIQQSLLPKQIPDIAGLDISGRMIPAMQVGGDYFDLIPVSDKEVFVVVGDVSGKGLSASLYMTKLQTMIQIACGSGNANKSPKEVLVEINKRFYESVERSWFVTMTLALFNTEEKTVTFCRAGHMPIFIALNGSVKAFKTRGLGIGLERGLIFEKTLIQEKIELKSGEIFAFFSDGITEAMDEKYNLFGEEKLAELIKNKAGKNSKEIMNDIFSEINKFRGTAEQNDDMTMVLVKVK